MTRMTAILSFNGFIKELDYELVEELARGTGSFRYPLDRLPQMTAYDYGGVPVLPKEATIRFRKVSGWTMESSKVGVSYKYSYWEGLLE